MDKRPKAKKNKNTPPKTKCKRKSDGPTCSTFLHELTKRLAFKKREEEESPKSIVQTIIDSLTNALPVKFSKKSLDRLESPVNMEKLQTLSPELLPKDMLEITLAIPPAENDQNDTEELAKSSSFKMPRMPLVSSDVLKSPPRQKLPMADSETNTDGDYDVATEIAKHVSTLKRISLIAEEFNQKTAKNLKEIVDSVQEDLIKKLEEAKAEKEAMLAIKASSLQTVQE